MISLQQVEHILSFLGKELYHGEDEYLCPDIKEYGREGLHRFYSTLAVNCLHNPKSSKKMTCPSSSSFFPIAKLPGLMSRWRNPASRGKSTVGSPMGQITNSMEILNSNKRLFSSFKCSIECESKFGSFHSKIP